MGRATRSGRGRRTFALGAVVLLGIGLALLLRSHPSNADIYPNALWNCRASVARLTNPLPQALNNLEPVVANGNTNTKNPQADILGAQGPMDQPTCSGDNVALPSFDQPGQLTLQLPFAQTSIVPAQADTLDQTASSQAQAALVDLGGASGIFVQGLSSRASASCTAGKPSFTGSSHVAKITLGGNDIPIEQSILVPLANGIDGSGLKQLAQIWVNSQIPIKDASGNQVGLIQRALEIDVINQDPNQPAGLPPGSNSVLTLVAGEAKVTGFGDVCTRATPTPPRVVTGPGSTQTVTTGGGSGNGGGAPGGLGGPGGAGGVLGSQGSGDFRPNGQNGSTCGHLRMWFVRGHKARLSSFFGHRQVVRGRIVNCRGASIVKARIDVYHFINGHRRRLVKTGLRSRAHGRLTLILPLNLTTRTLDFIYRGNLDSGAVTSRKRLRLTVRSARTGRILRGPAPGPVASLTRVL